MDEDDFREDWLWLNLEHITRLLSSTSGFSVFTEGPVSSCGPPRPAEPTEDFPTELPPGEPFMSAQGQREREKNIISTWSQRTNYNNVRTFAQTMNILPELYFCLGSNGLFMKAKNFAQVLSYLDTEGEEHGLTGVTVLQRLVLFRHFEENLLQGGVHHPEAGQGQAVQALL